MTLAWTCSMVAAALRGGDNIKEQQEQLCIKE